MRTMRRLSSLRVLQAVVLIVSSLTVGCQRFRWNVRYYHNPVENPCDSELTADEKNKCRGLLKNLSDDENRLAALPPEYARKATYNSQEGLTQIGVPVANLFARRLRLENFTLNQNVVIGAIRLVGKGVDKRYNAGEETPITYTFVVRRESGFPHPDTDPVFKQDLGKWELYDTRNAWSLKSSGTVKECEHNSDGHNSTIVEADFLTCKAVKAIHIQAALRGRTFTQMRIGAQAFHEYAVQHNLTTHSVLTQLINGSINPDDIKGPRSIRLSFLTRQEIREFADALSKADYDPEEAPFWFSCGAGCCTAEG